MATSELDQIRARLADLEKRYATCNTRKSKLQGQLEAKKQELLALKEEIEAAGFNPRQLKQAMETAKKDLVTKMEEFERNLVQVEQAIADFEK
jgi:chromosome segregation ATPase